MKGERGVGGWRVVMLAAISLFASTIQASPILGEPIVGGQMKVASDGDVFAIFLGYSAGYTSTLYFLGAGDERPTDSVDDAMALFTNKRASPGDRVLLGAFETNELLWFGLRVHNTGNVFFTGDASLNPDAVAHAIAVTLTDTSDRYYTDLGLEDLYAGGDQDFNDFRFRLTNVIDPPAQVPAPAPIALMLVGIAGALPKFSLKTRAA